MRYPAGINAAPPRPNWGDIGLAIDAVAVGTPVPGAGYRIRTDAFGGGWRGRVVSLRGVDGDKAPTLLVRTWLSGNDPED